MLQIPASAIITAIIGLTVLIAATQIERTAQSNLSSPKYTEPLLTLGQTLLDQYLVTGLSVGTMITKMEMEFGNSGSDRLLKVVDTTIFVRHDLKQDRLYTLRGLILRHMERENEAAESFKLALKSNPDSMDARMSLVIHYMKEKRFGSARTEIEKVLIANEIKHESKTGDPDISHVA